MKAYSRLLFLAMAALLLHARAQADSPLTSTPFADAYHKVGIVKAAIKAKGVLTAKLMKFLSTPSKPLDQKMAVINQIGWNIDGKDNGRLYRRYLEKKYGLTFDSPVDWDKLYADELLSLAYLQALDNYFDVKEAALMARAAVARLPKSYTAHIVAGLILSQEAFDTNWCDVYKITDAVRQNTALTQDMRPEAIKIIFDYMDIYLGEC